MNAVRVRKKDANNLLALLFGLNAVDKNFRIAEAGKMVYVPLARGLGSREKKEIKSIGGELVNREKFIMRNRVPVPLYAIKSELESKLSRAKLKALPEKWELVGDVLTIKLAPTLLRDAGAIAKAYAGQLGAKTVLLDRGGVTGVCRIPDVDFIYGNDAVTVHRENRIRFKLDASKIMFASGNKEERKRMANISRADETVVDMFAGIGYFSIPMAVHSKPMKIYSCELNPVAHRYLCENIKLNKVEDVVVPIRGNCRKVAPEGVADRVIMGHFDSYKFLSKAINVLKDDGGVLHYHEACPNDLFSRPEKRIKAAAARQEKKAEILRFRVVKSYAPCVSHVAVDARVSPI